MAAEFIRYDSMMESRSASPITFAVSKKWSGISQARDFHAEGYESAGWTNCEESAELKMRRMVGEDDSAQRNRQVRIMDFYGDRAMIWVKRGTADDEKGLRIYREGLYQEEETKAFYGRALR